MKNCKDEVIAVIEVDDHGTSIRRTKNYDSIFVGLDAYYKHKHVYSNPIVIVTESPHIEEFKVNRVNDFMTGLPVNSRPVNGVSGSNIMNYLIPLIDNSDINLENGKYPVIVLNALHQQCSLGVDTLIHRTKNFLKLWKSHRKFLESRLKTIQPTIVLCACTVGDFYLKDGTKAYGSGREVFSNNFANLLTEEFSLKPCNNLGSHVFMGAFDLSGLVLNIIHKTFGNKVQHIYKTTHPSSWLQRHPVLRKYNTQEYSYENITSSS
ncbi:hypothetical protein BIY22_08910 [Vibrio panuliri]|uniref:Uncharacterized protein n=1 Tax=Vibrio panuliri TaxID=1381081 RepID=A0A1Q9HEV9_9VIBR|nr:hypothetical protein [Vibrio panuliri]OLQ88274.1 hypothetical protein BIY22_08910 [Vibrio panuliri]